MGTELLASKEREPAPGCQRAEDSRWSVSEGSPEHACGARANPHGMERSIGAPCAYSLNVVLHDNALAHDGVALGDSVR